MCDECKIVDVSEESLQKAAHILRQGGVVVFPTDTVYGLGCLLTNADAVQRIYEIKGRPTQMPLIAMLATPDSWSAVARELSPVAKQLIRRWWPGPLTVIAPARSDIPARVLGDGTTIGMRIPDHLIALRLFQLVGKPLATTSANLSGHPAKCDAHEVAQELGHLVDLIINAGTCPHGKASTVVDCTTTPPTILREGPITRRELLASSSD